MKMHSSHSSHSSCASPSSPDWFTRPTDPVESSLAMQKINVGHDRKEAFERFSDLIADPDFPFSTRKVFEFEYLIASGLDAVRADSLTRRLSDLVVRPTNPFPAVLHLFCGNGQRFNGSAILVHTVWGQQVLDDPSMMTGLWGQKRRVS